MFKSTLISLCQAFLLSFAIGLFFYFPYLRMAFIFDDLPLLVRSSPEIEPSVLGSFLPMPNGFWRPLHTLFARSIECCFGRKPLAFHVASIVLHGMNGMLVYSCARVGLAASHKRALLGAFFFSVQIAGFAAVLQPGNVADLLLTFALLCSLVGWFLREEKWGMVLFAGGLVLGIMSKETIVVLPVILLLLSRLNQLRLNDAFSDNRFNVALNACGAFALLVILLQLPTKGSYLHDGMVQMNPLAIIRQFLDYCVSLLFPYIHALEFPVRHIALPTVILQMIRLGIALGLAFMVRQVFFAERPSAFPVLLLCAAATVLPVSVLGFGIQSRFLYAGTAFVALAGVALLGTPRGNSPLSLCILGALLAINAIGFTTPQSLIQLKLTASRTDALIQQLKVDSKDWNKGDRILIPNHPHHAPEAYDWVYRQLLFDLTFGAGRFVYVQGDQATGDERVIIFQE